MHGNVWTSSADSLRAYASDRILIGRIRFAELLSNFCVRGPRRNRLHITAQTSPYAIYLNPYTAN
jgi:gluconolactonase